MRDLTGYPKITDQEIEHALQFASEQVYRNLPMFTEKFQNAYSVDNFYAPIDNVDWTNGFWTGEIWLAYEWMSEHGTSAQSRDTGAQSREAGAQEQAAELRAAAEVQVGSFYRRIADKIEVDHHDMGFLYTPSCVAAYKLTGNEEAKETALLAADNLMRRYHEKGEFLQAWGEIGAPDNYRLIIDCLLNIPLLYWASEVTGDKKYEEIAFKHYKSTAANIMRPDGSTFHTFYFDPETGKPTKGVTHQGFRDDSCWSRGQAWGIYGPLMTYMYEKNPDAIEFFKRTSRYFMEHLPEDFIAYWDLAFTSGDEERDSSAAAIAACGLIEGANVTGDEGYLNAAKNMINSLIDGYLTKDIPESNGLLLHAVYGKPMNNGVDECNIWGDYFYMEALARLIKGKDFRAYW